MLKSRSPVSIVIDYNDERKGTYAFVNALTFLKDKPIAVAGIGLSLEDISGEFQSYKFGEKSNMWIIDDRGTVYLSEDTQHINQNISSYLPGDIVAKVISTGDGSDAKYNVLEYKQADGETFDLIYKNLSSTNWKLVFQIPRSESLSILKSIIINTVFASLIAIIAIVAIFFLISIKIANPYKRALMIQKELEDKVNERTRELKEKNEKIMDSIEYAKMIQEAILPSSEELKRLFREHFII